MSQRLESITVYYGMGPCSVLAFYSAYLAILVPSYMPCETAGIKKPVCCSAASLHWVELRISSLKEGWEHALITIFWVLTCTSRLLMGTGCCSCESWERQLWAVGKERNKVEDLSLFRGESNHITRRRGQKFQPDLSCLASSPLLLLCIWALRWDVIFLH